MALWARHQQAEATIERRANTLLFTLYRAFLKKQDGSNWTLADFNLGDGSKASEASRKPWEPTQTPAEMRAALYAIAGGMRKTR